MNLERIQHYLHDPKQYQDLSDQELLVLQEQISELCLQYLGKSDLICQQATRLHSAVRDHLTQCSSVVD